MFKSTGFWQSSAVIGFLAVTLIDPYDYHTWLLETVGIVAGIGVVLCLWRRGIRPTPLLSWCLVLHAGILIYGAWHSFSRAPLGAAWTEWFGWERNHYDRLAHFAQGLFPAVLIREVLARNRVVNGRAWREFLVFACAMSFGALFELVEFAAALGLGDGSPTFLGSQGDAWDAQWDMLWCGVGALVSIWLLSGRHEVDLAQLPNEAEAEGSLAADPFA